MSDHTPLGEAAREYAAAYAAHYSERDLAKALRLYKKILQTLSKIATGHNSTAIFPVPIAILRPFYQVDRRRQAAGEGGGNAG